MIIKQLKKEFEKEFLPCKYPFAHSTEKCMGLDKHDTFEKLWQFIEKEVIPQAMKAMLVEEREDKITSGLRNESCNAKVIFNQCCALQRERYNKLTNK